MPRRRRTGGRACGRCSRAPLPKRHIVAAPMVGTFYARRVAGAKPFVEIGSEVKDRPGAVHHRSHEDDEPDRSDKAGHVTAILAKNGDPVEFGQPLFVIE